MPNGQRMTCERAGSRGAHLGERIRTNARPSVLLLPMRTYALGWSVRGFGGAEPTQRIPAPERSHHRDPGRQAHSIEEVVGEGRPNSPDSVNRLPAEYSQPDGKGYDEVGGSCGRNTIHKRPCR